MHHEGLHYIWLQLQKVVMARGNVELWLGELLAMQQKSLHSIIEETSNVINDQAFDMLNFVNNYIAQVCVSVQYVHYSRPHVCRHHPR